MRIQTTSGLVEGHTEEEHQVFNGIPFGTAARFRRPVPFHGSESVPVNGIAIQPLQNLMAMPAGKDGKDFAAIMGDTSHLQVGENCLNLNVTAPTGLGKFPVVIDVFGGGFTKGGSLITPTMRWLKQQSVVHVAINYRVGLLGWAQLPEIADTNVGLYDQALAIQWVLDNIQNFGGDVNNITVVGASAGAKSVSALMASNFAVMDHIQKVWTVSGAFQCIRDSHTASQVSQNYLNLNHVADVYDLLQVDSDSILKMEKQFGQHANTNDFGPVIDEETISTDWSDVLQRRLNQHSYHVMVSSSDNEYAMQAKMGKSDLSGLQQSAKELFGSNAGHVLADADTVAEVIKTIGYYMYRLPGNQATERYANNAKTAVWACHSNIIGGIHTSDVAVMGLASNMPALRPLIANWQHRFLNFANTGYPTGSNGDDFDWEQYTPQQRKYLYLTGNGFQLQQLEQSDLRPEIKTQALLLQ